ncbi:MAG: hypothetical protein K6D02_05990, partial [Lachnospiraceae bacterium]|nr:hypothetical protein [Lachnospiraceae bacterium]
MAKSIKSLEELNIPAAYELEQSEYINDVDSFAMLFRHKKTKARVLVLSNEDINKVFNIAFRTPSDSDKGVQHIIEHTVL